LTSPFPSTNLAAITVVLDHPQDVTNVGAVIRAMKNMGCSDLRLVEPVPLDVPTLRRVAHRCEDLIASMQIYASLDAALADMVYVVGTAALAHRNRPQTQDIRALAPDLVTRAAGGRVALVFGEEANGLDHHALDRCHLLVTLPTNPAYPALNLAQSVLLLLYEVRMATVTSPAAPATPAPLAQHQELETLFALNEQALTAIDFLRKHPAHTLRALRQIIYRAQLTQTEASLLMAIVRKIIKKYGDQATPGGE